MRHPDSGLFFYVINPVFKPFFEVYPFLWKWDIKKQKTEKFPIKTKTGRFLANQPENQSRYEYFEI